MEISNSLANYTSKYNFSIIVVRARGIHFLFGCSVVFVTVNRTKCRLDIVMGKG